MNKFIVKVILNLHTKFYHLASRFAKMTDGGIHPKHRLTQYHEFFMNNVNPENIVLDIGCGSGEMAFDLAQKVQKVFAVDINPKKIEKAKIKFQRDNVEYLIGDVTKDLSEKKFDVIVLSNVLEHIENRKEFLEKIKNLAPKILIRVPMMDRDWITLYKKDLGLEWRLNNGHFIEYTLKSFQEEMNQANLKIDNYSIQFGEIWAVLNS